MPPKRNIVGILQKFKQPANMNDLFGNFMKSGPQSQILATPLSSISLSNVIDPDCQIDFYRDQIAF